jgi:predicted nucleic acid-binding protein
MSKPKDETKILLDADVVIHFVKAGYQMKLTSIFPGRLIMLDKVKQELMKRRSDTLGIANFLDWCKIPVESMPNDVTILREYARLKQLRGEGESACMAVARFRSQYIASSNLRDIREYCEEYGITYYTTMEILEEAMNTGMMTETECDQFISEVKQKKSRLPVNSMKDYFQMKGRLSQSIQDLQTNTNIGKA